MLLLLSCLGLLALVLAAIVYPRLTPAADFTTLRGKVVVVTGAASGIGREVARLAARNGARLVISDRRADRLAESAVDCRALGAADVLEVVADVTQRDQCLDLARRAAEFGSGAIDVLALIAGVSMDFEFAETKPEASAMIMNVNLFGPAWTAEEAAQALARARGRVLVVSSMSALLPRARRCWYAASKAAVKTLFDNIRFEFAPMGVSVTVGLPGFVATEMATGVSRLDAQGRSLGANASSASGAAAHGFSMMQPDDVARRLVAATLARRRSIACPPWYELMTIGPILFPALYDCIVSRHKKH
eukprot:m51a1_g5742 putative hydroxysteroid dehydrogenase (304) ;mRNA; r:1164625-1165711